MGWHNGRIGAENKGVFTIVKVKNGGDGSNRGRGGFTLKTLPIARFRSKKRITTMSLTTWF